MRSKTPLALMEQVIMVLVFALAAALCLRAFVLSDRISHACEERDRAVMAVQTVAETLKLCRGDLEETERIAESALDNVDVVSRYDGQNGADSASDLIVSISPAESGAALMSCAEITAFNSKGETVLTLTAAWQEVTGNG